jgi:hypothetical protein
MDPAGPATRSSCPTSAKWFPPIQPGKQRLKMKAGRKKGKREEVRGEQAEAAPRASKGQKVIYIQSFGFYCRPSLLGAWCACAGSKGPVIAR